MVNKLEELGQIYDELDEKGKEEMVSILEERLEKIESDQSSEAILDLKMALV